MRPYNVLDPQSPISGKIFIEASAGTGKTFAIEHMVLRLILQGIHITEILVVTFTKSGAQDLKRRIHTSLLHIDDMLTNNNLMFPYLSAVKNIDEAKLLIKNACALSSEMPIYTIHGFAYQMLSSFAFEAGIDFDLLHFDEQKYTDHTLTAILDTLRSETSEKTISSAQCIRMVDLYQRKLSTLTKKISQLIENDRGLEPQKNYEDLQNQFYEYTEGICYEALLDEFMQVAHDYKRIANREKIIHPHLFEQIKALADGNIGKLIVSSPSIIEMLHDNNLKKNAKRKNLKLLEVIDHIAPIFSILKDPMTPITHLAIKAKKRLEKQAIKSPDAILSSMLTSLKRKTFKQKIHNIFSCCIIDEFQDTDLIQWEILSSLFYSSSTLFCTVGDPKQSIYAFRGADLPTYLQAKKSFPLHYSLDTNFRSNKNIIDLLNKTFSEQTSPSFLSFEQDCDNLKYTQVKAGKGNSSPSDVKMLLCPMPKKRTLTASLTEAEYSYFFPHIVNIISNLNIDLDEVAILVKDRYQGLRLSIYLQNLHIPTRANISSSLLDSSMFSLFETLLFLTYSPRSESLIKKLLTYPLINALTIFYKKTLKTLSSKKYLSILLFLTKLSNIRESIPFYITLWKKKSLAENLLVN